MKKTETIALYRDAFLEGKDEETRRKFDEKDINKQYSSIIAWRRRRNISSDDDEQPSAALALELLKKAKKLSTPLTHFLREIQRNFGTPQMKWPTM